MKKSIYILTSLFIFLIISPIFAQPTTPGDDPDAAAPIDESIWVMVVVAITFAVLKFRAVYKQGRLRNE